MSLHVDDAEAERERRVEFLEEPQVLAAPAGELERDLMDPCLEDRREQIAVAALPRRLAVAVAIAHVQAQPRVHAVDERVDGTHPPRQILGEPGVVGLIDLDLLGAGAHQLAQLEVHDARDLDREHLFGRVELVADSLDQRMRPGDGDLRPSLGEPAEKAEVLDEPERGHRHAVAHDALVEVVVRGLGAAIDLDAGKARGEVVDHVVAPELAVGDDVEPGDLLVLDRRLHGRIVHLVEVVGGDPPPEEVVLRALQPGGHRVAADDGGGKVLSCHGLPHSRRVV